MKNIKKVIFRKIENNHNKLRDDEIHGETFCLPVVGCPFLMVGPPRDISVGFRQVNTSKIVEILSRKGSVTTFKTESGSIYSVEEKE